MVSFSFITSTSSASASNMKVTVEESKTSDLLRFRVILKNKSINPKGVLLTVRDKDVFLKRKGYGWISPWLRGNANSYLRKRAEALIFIGSSGIKLVAATRQHVPLEKTKISIPGSVPTWKPNIKDYTVLCPSSKPTLFKVSGDHGVSINGSIRRVGSFSKKVSLKTGQSTRIKSYLGTQTIRCRPNDMPLPKVEGRGKMNTYLVAPTISFNTNPSPKYSHNYAMITDNNGTPIWWHKEEGGIIDFKAVAKDTLAWILGGSSGFVIGPNSAHFYGLDGKEKRKLSPVGFGADHHDIQKTKDGGWLLIGYVPRNCPDIPSECVDLSAYGGSSQATVIDAIIQKVDDEGKEVWSWKSRNHLDLAESSFWLNTESVLAGSILTDGRTAIDTVHVNSVEETSNGFIFSARHTNAVYSVTDPSGSGNIEWKLGGLVTPESLDILDDPYSETSFGGQHDARLLDNGDVTIYDNGSLRSRSPRVVRYTIDKQARTARLVESLEDPKIVGSTCCGSSRKLSTGGWLASWGGNSTVAEYDVSHKSIFRMTWPDEIFSYRAVAATEKELSKESLRNGMDSQYRSK